MKCTTIHCIDSFKDKLLLKMTSSIHPFNSKHILVFSGNANLKLAEDITQYLGTHISKATVGRFADGEVNIQIYDNIRGKDIYII